MELFCPLWRKVADQVLAQEQNINLILFTLDCQNVDHKDTKYLKMLPLAQQWWCVRWWTANMWRSWTLSPVSLPACGRGHLQHVRRALRTRFDRHDHEPPIKLRNRRQAAVRRRASAMWIILNLNVRRLCAHHIKPYMRWMPARRSEIADRVCTFSDRPIDAIS